MPFSSSIYPLDTLPLPWGLTLGEAAARLQHLPQLLPYGGWPNLRVACRSVFGLAATEANLRAPARHKPVLQVSYELAAPPQFRGQPQEAGQWQQPLTELLGAPSQTQAYTESWCTGSGNVVYTARWQVGLVRVSLSVFGGVRQQASGPTAAALYLDWQDELTAAQPFLAAAETQAAALEAVAGQAAGPLVFRLQQRQTPYHLAHYDAPTPDPGRGATQLRQAQRALYREGLCETPTRFQNQLSDYEVALWAVPGRAAWAISTRTDTVVLTAAGPRVQLITLRPAKGGGSLSLDVGDLSLRDAYSSAALPALADTLGTTGLAVSRVAYDDC